MSADWIAAFAAVGTFVVIGASAVAALMQIRHLRGNNQIAAFLEIRETMESTEFREAHQFVVTELPKRLMDPQELPKVTAVPLTGEYEPVRSIANLFEGLGILVKAGIIDAAIACDMWSIVATRTWNNIAPIVEYERWFLGTPSIWENFEYFTILSEDYLRKHASSYPPRVRRMAPDASLVDVVKRRDRAARRATEDAATQV